MSLCVAEAPVCPKILERFQLLVQVYQRGRPFNQVVVREAHTALVVDLHEHLCIWPQLHHELTMIQKLWLLCDDQWVLYPLLIVDQEAVARPFSPRILHQSSPSISAAA